MPLRSARVDAVHRVLSLTIPAYLALGLLGTAARLPFVRPTPINWDAVQFELALSRFDLHAHQPHPPGYILYVVAGRLLNAAVGQPSVALALLSVLASAVAVPLAAWLALRIFGDVGVALGAALMLAASPLALYYGSVGLTYAPEMAFSLGVAALAWKLKNGGDARTAALFGVCLGLAGGVRQTSLLALLPVGLWALCGTTDDGRRTTGIQSSKSSRFTFHVSRFIGRPSSLVHRLLPFAFSLAITCALWLVPLLALSGGPTSYLRESALLARRASAGTSIFVAGPEGVASNLAFLGTALGVGLAFALVPLGLWAARALRFSLARDASSFFLWWTVPSLALFAVGHVGQYGYMLVVLPPLLMLSALCVRVLVERWARGRKRTAIAATVVLCATFSLLSAGYFALADGPVTASNITQNDAYWRAVERELGLYDPAETALLMDSEWDGPFRQAGYLLPGFHAYSTGKDEDHVFGWLYSAYGGQSTYALPHPPAQSYLALPEGTRTLVAMERDTAERLEQGGAAGLANVPMPGGRALYVLHSEVGSLSGIEIVGENLRPVREGVAEPTRTRP